MDKIEEEAEELMGTKLQSHSLKEELHARGQMLLRRLWLWVAYTGAETPLRVCSAWSSTGQNKGTLGSVGQRRKMSKDKTAESSR